MLILLVQIVMTAATLCYAAGLAVRHSNNPLHRALMLTGFGFTLGIAVVLVVGVHVFGATYGPAEWLVGMGNHGFAYGVLIAHRLLATVTFLLLVAQVITGIRRQPAHHWLFKPVIPLWLLTYVSGMVIFE